MPNSMFQGGEPSDTRFQFEVIKGLADSIRQMAAQMGDMQKTQVNMLERLATLEAGKVTTRLDEQDDKISALMKDKDRRDGARGMLERVPGWLQFMVALASIFTAVWLAGRSAGLVPAPPGAVSRVEATIHPEERRIEGTVGGKP